LAKTTTQPEQGEQEAVTEAVASTEETQEESTGEYSASDAIKDSEESEAQDDDGDGESEGQEPDDEADAEDAQGDDEAPEGEFDLSQVPDSHREKITLALSYFDALNDPDEAPKAFAAIKASLERAGYLPTGESEAQTGDDEQNVPDFFSETEEKLWKENKALQDRLGKIEARIAKQDEQAALESFANRQAPIVKKALQAKYPGYDVTPKMVIKALAAYPQHKDDPQKAFIAFYGEQLGDHRVKLASQAKRAPTMARTGRVEGNARVNPREYTAMDAIREAGG